MWVFNATADRVILLNPRAVAGAAGASLTADNRFTGNQTFQGRVNTATSVAGTADAITATYSPPFTAWVDRMHGRFRATGANTTTAPTFSPDGLVAKTIVKENLVALAAGDIAGAGHEVEWIFNAAADRVVLLNPRVVGGLGGSGTINRVARFTGASTLGNSVIFDTGTNIGIGTTTPSTRLDVQGSLFVGGGTFSNADGWASVIDLLGGDHSRLSVRTAGIDLRLASHAWGWAGSPAGSVVGTQSNHPLSFMTNGASRVTIDVSGNVGIRTTSPTARLHVLGVDSLNTAFAGNISGATGTGLVITNANNVGIGTTTPTATLHLRAGTAAANTAPLKFTSGALNTTPEPGAVEFLGDAFHGTITTGAVRRTFAFLESPTFTGTVTIPTPFTLGTVSVAATGAELNHLVGVTSAIQTQINARAPIASPTFTGNVTMPGTGSWNSLGNVGIGTMTPATRLHVAGTTRGVGGAQILALPTPGTPTVTPQGVTGTTIWGYRVTARSAVGETLASIEGRTTTGNATLSATNFNRITWSAVSGAVDYGIYRTTAGGTPAATGLIVITPSLTFDDTGLAAVVPVPIVDSSGNVSIGTTSSEAKVEIQDLNNPRIRFRQTGVVNHWETGIISSVSFVIRDSANALNVIILEGGGGYIQRNQFGVVMSVSNNDRNISFVTGSGGNVGIGTPSPTFQLQLSTDSAGKPATNTWTIISDKRLKKSIELANLDLCYNAVKAIPLSFYRWRDDVYSIEQVRDRGMLGWIADDVEKVYPKAVKTVPFELLTKEKIEDCKSVNNDQVYAALYGAVQKLIEKVEALERRIR
ncbi:MAG: hypothetical protein DDT19_02114 [Syntrophomonadaceae bacterium]|nr:hypothetical protein [Bacillota bacterium]